ncbi:unnamed protein product [Parascedosporium putredinis]|uniref:Protein transport protein SEC13 n=1 Tax=Parascedosporium putredinis TaxID=1442378 RepID=A0A9P1HB72_9PEZI|nr:unnamed protein product [Parascedosporium putredinis]CAI8003673.1 unnamed protein product [Parascedosporium putredinis]
MSAPATLPNSGHDEMIHDAVLDYYGRRLATCSSDRTIKIFEVDGDSQRLLETLKGHEGAVWCIMGPSKIWQYSGFRWV